MRLPEQEALDIVEKRIFAAKVERNQANWKNNWRPVFSKLESVRRYLLSHLR